MRDVASLAAVTIGVTAAIVIGAAHQSVWVVVAALIFGVVVWPLLECLQRDRKRKHERLSEKHNAGRGTEAGGAG